MNQLDHIDQEIMNAAVALRDQLTGPRMGDFVLFPTGQLERFSHDWGAGIQTSPGGSFHLSRNGHGSLSCGGLNPCIPADSLAIAPAVLPGQFWFFHRGVPGAGRAVYCEAPCRVFTTNAPYQGFLGSDFQSALLQQLKDQLRHLAVSA